LNTAETVSSTLRDWNEH